MKKWVVIAALLVFAFLLVGGYPTSPLHGTIKAVTVTKKYFAPVATNSQQSEFEEKTVRIQDPERVVAIEKSLNIVWSYFGANSMEGLPRYRMQVEYSDGKTEAFVFTRTEWGGSGRTPRTLLEELEKNGL